MPDGKGDDIKGRAKEAAGELTDDDSRTRARWMRPRARSKTRPTTSPIRRRICSASTDPERVPFRARARQRGHTLSSAGALRSHLDGVARQAAAQLRMVRLTRGGVPGTWCPTTTNTTGGSLRDRGRPVAPPTISRDSTTRTRAPSSMALSAAIRPAPPDPTIATSTSSGMPLCDTFRWSHCAELNR
jgi:hypothetical protein